MINLGSVLKRKFDKNFLMFFIVFDKFLFMD